MLPLPFCMEGRRRRKSHEPASPYPGTGPMPRMLAPRPQPNLPAPRTTIGATVACMVRWASFCGIVSRRVGALAGGPRGWLRARSTCRCGRAGRHLFIMNSPERRNALADSWNLVQDSRKNDRRMPEGRGQSEGSGALLGQHRDRGEVISSRFSELWGCAGEM